MKSYILTVEYDELRLVVSEYAGQKWKCRDRIKVTSIEQLRKELDELAAPNPRCVLHVMCSSSLDFPEESTSDKSVIALCKQIRE